MVDSVINVMNGCDLLNRTSPVQRKEKSIWNHKKVWWY